jgi:hypothetical protein
MKGTELTKLSAIPYLDVLHLQGRFISTLTFYDAGNWRMWIPAGDQLVEVKAWPAEAFYFSSGPDVPTVTTGSCVSSRSSRPRAVPAYRPDRRHDAARLFAAHYGTMAQCSQRDRLDSCAMFPRKPACLTRPSAAQTSRRGAKNRQALPASRSFLPNQLFCSLQSP